MLRGDGLFHKPPAHPLDELRANVFKTQLLLPPLDPDGEAVPCRVVAHCTHRVEVLHRLDGKSTLAQVMDKSTTEPVVSNSDVTLTRSS